MKGSFKPGACLRVRATGQVVWVNESLTDDFPKEKPRYRCDERVGGKLVSAEYWGHELEPCLTIADAAAGDRVIYKRADGLHDVEDVIEPGKLETARGALTSLTEAREVALAHKKSGSRLWVRRHATPNLIEPYKLTG